MVMLDDETKAFVDSALEAAARIEPDGGLLLNERDGRAVCRASGTKLLYRELAPALLPSVADGSMVILDEGPALRLAYLQRWDREAGEGIFWQMSPVESFRLTPGAIRRLRVLVDEASV